MCFPKLLNCDENEIVLSVMVQSMKNVASDGVYGRIDIGTSNKVQQNEDCVLELVTADGASSRFLLNEIIGRYYSLLIDNYIIFPMILLHGLLSFTFSFCFLVGTDNQLAIFSPCFSM